MKTIHTLAMLAMLAGFTQIFAQGIAFIYQGQLQNNGNPAIGRYDLKFTLFNTNTGGSALANSETNTSVLVANGLLVAQIDFGPGIFTGASNWLEIAVTTNGAKILTTLTPRQHLTPTPNAIYAKTTGGVPGLTIQNNINGAPNVIGGSPFNSVATGVVGGDHRGRRSS